MKFSLNRLQKGLLQTPPNRGDKDLNGRAAVLVAITDPVKNPKLLLTQRSHHLNQHAGEVAFPGGMWEPGDAFPVDTAVREAHEEVALTMDQIQVLGVLPNLPTRRLLEVSPVVAITTRKTSLIANPDEIETIFSVPIDYFMADRRIRTDIFPRRGKYQWAPAYNYCGYEIWGFTAAVITLLLNRCFDADILRKHSAPEKRW